MLRTIVKNESILRGTLSKSGIIRCLSVSTIRKFKCLRISATEPISLKPQTSLWSQNFVRNFAALPAHTKVALPALSPTMEHGTIISWEKKEGDKLNEGDLLAEIETDKATMGFETPEEGFLAKILVQAGQKDIKVGRLVCIIVENEADVAAFKDFKDDGAVVAAPGAPPAPAAAPAVAAKPAAAAAPSAPPPAAAAAPSGPAPMTAVQQKGGERILVSPMAKKLAEAQQLRLQGRGSGVHGSIKSDDLGKMQAAAPAAASAQGGGEGNPFIDIPVTNVRKVIAKRLLESKQSIPHYYVSVECQMDKLLKFRAHVNKKYEKKCIRVSVNDFIIKACAIACVKVPEVNSYWMDTVIRQFKNVDISIAVSTEKGLITPIVFEADRKGVIDISKDIKELAGKARENKLQPHEFTGGTFCVSNLGMFGVNNFCAVINPPQSCILAVGTTSKKLIPDPDSEKGFKVITVMNVTLSSDHRTVDGAIAARWLQHFRDYMEDPQTMIL